MARFASWCEREEVHACWKSIWKASSVVLAACSSGRKAGLSHSFRSLIESCRAWLLPEGQKGQRYSAPWLEWMSQSLSVLCWLEEHTLDTRGNNRQKLLASGKSKYLPERVRAGIRDGRVHPDALAATAEWLTRQLLGPLFQARHDGGIVHVLCGRYAKYGRFGPRRGDLAPGLRTPELRMSKQNPLGLKRKVKLLSDTAGGQTILEVSRHSLEQARALERIMIRTRAPTCNTRGLYEVGKPRPRRPRRRPRARPAAHLRSDNLRQSAPLDSLGASLEEELIRWQTCRSRWLKRQQVLRDLSHGFHRFYRQLLDCRLAAGLGPGPIALTVNLALSTIAALRPSMSLASLNLDESQAPSAWRFARQMPRPGTHAS